MSTVVRVPFFIKEVLREVRAVVPSAIVAGGAIRDALNDRPVKDIDVFIPSTYAEKIVTVTQRMGFTWENLGATVKSNSGAKCRSTIITQVLACDNMSDYDVQLICVTNNDPVAHVKQFFDFGICKTWYDGSYVECHRDYLKDINNQLISCVLSNKEIDQLYSDRPSAIHQMADHASRIKQKYPTHTIITPNTEGMIVATR